MQFVMFQLVLVSIVKILSSSLILESSGNFTNKNIYRNTNDWFLFLAPIFWYLMEKRRLEIEERFKNYQKKEGKENNNFLRNFSIQKDQFLKELEEFKDLKKIQEEIYQLNQELQENTHYLSNYDIQKCTESLKILRKNLEEKLNQNTSNFSFNLKDKKEGNVTKSIEKPKDDIKIEQIEKKVFSKLENMIIDNLDKNEDFIVKDCTSSQVYITCITGALYLNDIKDSLICVAPVKGSIILRNCTNCQFILASNQVRVLYLPISYVFMNVLIVIFLYFVKILQLLKNPQD